MRGFDKQAVVATIGGIPIPAFDTEEIKIGGEGFRFGLKPDSNSMIMLSQSLGMEVGYKVEYVGNDCDGLKEVLGRLFEQEGVGILQIEEIKLAEDNPHVLFSISPSQIF